MKEQQIAFDEISDINEYMEYAKMTAVFGCPDYPLVAMGEEVGEVMGKIAKFGRKNDMPVVAVIRFINEVHADAKGLELRAAVFKEMGDVMWQWVMLCHVLGFNPAEVMAENINKLQDRKQRDVLNGEGDNR